MGRTLKRVPLDFNHPQGKVWEGFLNPYYKNGCPEKCNGGYSKTYWLLESFLRGQLSLSSVNVQNEPDFTKILNALNGTIPSVPGFDYFGVITDLGESVGLPRSFTACATCGGNGIDPNFHVAYENWKPEEPPVGEGFQLWETTSEGSPASPVFPSLEALCAWCEENATTFGSFKATKSEWMNMLGSDNVYHCEGNVLFM